MRDAEKIIDDISSEEEENMKSLGFEWEKTFGKMTHERLEQLQRYATDQDYVKKSFA